MIDTTNTLATLPPAQTAIPSQAAGVPAANGVPPATLADAVHQLNAAQAAAYHNGEAVTDANREETLRQLTGGRYGLTDAAPLMRASLVTATQKMLAADKAASANGETVTDANRDQVIRDLTHGQYGLADVNALHAPDTSVNLRNLARSAGQGASLGFSDELLGRLPKAVGGGADAEAQMRANQAAFQKARPWLDVGAKVVGALGVPIAATALAATLPEDIAGGALLAGGGTVGTIARGAAAGAGLAGAQAAGESNAPDLAGRARAAVAPTVMGGVMGGVLAPVAPLASRAAGSIYDRLASFIPGTAARAARLSSDVAAPTAARAVNSALAAAGTSADAVPTEGGAMVADAIPGYTRAVRTAAPAQSAAMDQALAARSAQDLPVLRGALERAAGVRQGELPVAQQQVIAQKQIDAAAGYAKAYAAPDVTDPEVLKTLQLPQFQAAYERGQRLASLEGNPIPDLGTTPGVSVRAIDYTKRGLNDVIGSGMASGSVGRGEARALTGRLNDMLGRVDAAVPDYASARATFAGHSALEDAARAGGEDFSHAGMAPADVQHKLAQLSPSEAEMYRRGAIEAVLAKADAMKGSAEGKATYLANLYSSIGGRGKIQALAQSPREAATLDQIFEQRALQNATRNRVTGGSNTAEKLAGAGALDGRPLFTLGDAARMVLYPHYGAAHAAGKVIDAALGKQAAGVAAQAAPGLVSTGPELQAFLAALRDRAAADAVRNRVGGFVGNVARLGSRATAQVAPSALVSLMSPGS